MSYIKEYKSEQCYEKRYYNSKNLLHNIGGPAYINYSEDPDDCKCWFENGYKHRIGAPSCVRSDGYHFYYLKGINVEKHEACGDDDSSFTDSDSESTSSNNSTNESDQDVEQGSYADKSEYNNFYGTRGYDYEFYYDSEYENDIRKVKTHKKYKYLLCELCYVGEHEFRENTYSFKKYYIIYEDCEHCIHKKCIDIYNKLNEINHSEGCPSCHRNKNC